MARVGVLLSLCLLFVGVQSYYEPGAEKEEPLNEAARAVNTFGAKLAAEYRQSNKQKNYVFSPLSLSTIFFLLYQGAGGETRHQLAALFNFDNEDVAKSMKREPKFVQKQGSVQLANRLYVAESVSPTHSFRNAIGKKNIERVNFGDSETVSDEINSWVEENTNGMITDIVEPSMLSAGTVLVLANAIHFQGTWRYKFKPADTFMGAFHGIHGVEIVPMMYQRDLTLTIKDLPMLGGRMLAIPYHRAKFTMYLFLPDNAKGLKKFEKNYERYASSMFDWGYGTQMIDAFIMPKWELDGSLDGLESMLADLGIPDTFSGKADFSGIAKHTPITVTDVIHKAKIVVDEEGTEASAASVVVTARSAAGYPPINVTIDRPFHYFIVALNDRTVLFQGAQYTLSKAV